MKSIHIFYRHIHEKHNQRSRDPNKTRPTWFSHESCFANLLDTVQKSNYSKNVTITMIYDGTPAEFNSDFVVPISNLYSQVPIEVKITDAGSNLASWRVAIQCALEANIRDEDFIYFLENDYLHQYGWLDRFLELCDSNVLFSYVSLYDHRDKYFYDMYSGLASQIYVTSNHHWRTTPSTCGSFLVTRKILAEDAALWAREVQDHFQFQELFQQRNRVLVSPIPGLSTHCMEHYLSPTIDWARLIKAHGMHSAR
jgi:hypothetical protein